MNTRFKGRIGEAAAAIYLRLHFYKILKRNFDTSVGEIDIIAKRGRTLAFVEVKYRKNADRGLPREAVNKHKQNRIRRAAQLYIQYWRVDTEKTDIRFDVIEILGLKINHIKAAF